MSGGDWYKRVFNGTRLIDVSNAFAASDEFIATYGNLSDADFVYQNVLGRPGDAGGRSYWIGRLGAGTARGAVMVDFSESTEFIIRTQTLPR